MRLLSNILFIVAQSTGILSRGVLSELESQFQPSNHSICDHWSLYMSCFLSEAPHCHINTINGFVQFTWLQVSWFHTVSFTDRVPSFVLMLTSRNGLACTGHDTLMILPVLVKWVEKRRLQMQLPILSLKCIFAICWLHSWVPKELYYAHPACCIDALSLAHCERELPGSLWPCDLLLWLHTIKVPPTIFSVWAHMKSWE